MRLSASPQAIRLCSNEHDEDESDNADVDIDNGGFAFRDAFSCFATPDVFQGRRAAVLILL